MKQCTIAQVEMIRPRQEVCEHSKVGVECPTCTTSDVDRHCLKFIRNKGESSGEFVVSVSNACMVS